MTQVWMGQRNIAGKILKLILIFEVVRGVATKLQGFGPTASVPFRREGRVVCSPAART